MLPLAMLLLLQAGLSAKQPAYFALVLAIVFCACALLLFLRHVNKEEEIHITQ